MALVAKRMFGRSGARDYASEQNTYTEIWHVWEDDLQTPFGSQHETGNILSLAALPQPGTVYGLGTNYEDDTSYMSFAGCERDDENPRLWVITIEYRPPTFNSRSINPDDNIYPPTNRPPKRSMRYSLEEVPLWRDKVETDPEDQNLPLAERRGKPILLPNGRRFNVQPTQNRKHRIYRFEKYLATFPSTTFDAYVDSINKNAWQGFAAKTIKVLPMVPTEEFFQDPNRPNTRTSFWRTVFEFEHNPDGWNPQEIPAADVYELVTTTKEIFNPAAPSGGEFEEVTESELRRIKVGGQPVTDPVFLDADGAAVDMDEIAQGNASPYFISYNPHEEKDLTFFDPYISGPYYVN